MKRLVSLLCTLALTLGCMGGLSPAAFADSGPGASARANGLTYYVSTGGKAGNDGLSAEKPLPGLDAVPWDQLLPGDSVLLNKGDTFPGAVRMVGVHGTADKPVAIGTYGTGSAPVIEARGQGIWLQEEGSNTYAGNYASAGVLLYDCSYITVSGLDIVNRPDPMKASFQDAAGYADRDNKSDHSNEKLPCSGVAVAADGKAAAEGIVLRDITVRGDGDVQAVITETSSQVTQTGVTKGEEAAVRTVKNAGGTYYVSSLNGSDSNDGSSPEKAFYSLHKINELNLQPGAKVFLECGSVFENQYLHVNGGGSSSAPIVIDAYGSSSLGAPLINTNGEGVWYQNFGRNLDNGNHVRHGYVSSCVNLYDVEYVEVRNIAMTNGGNYGQTVRDFSYIGDAQVDGGTVPGETGFSTNGNVVGAYNWGGKMSRTGVSAVAQNKGTVDHVYLQNLDIENIYGNIYIKHMNNGGVYFTMAVPSDEASTGIATFSDVRIEGCYLKRTSRWGISAGYTGAYHDRFNGAQISDQTARTYGITGLYIGHNYLEEVGGDPITAMYSFKPVVEHNVATRGAREISVTYHSGSAPAYLGGGASSNKGTVAAGIWPWKCKTAVFQYNECFDMLNNEDGNGDGQPWDADYGDSTIYQYNYSSGNTGGCVMFCAGEAYNSVFRYNISYDDGSFGRPAGIIDMAGNAYGQIHNNTFVMKPDLRLHYRTSGPAQIENNIFYNLGEPFDPQWRQNSRVVFNNNIYCGFTTKPDHDGSAIEMEKSETLFAGDVTTAPTAPKTSAKSGTGSVKGIRTWSRDWARDFDMFKLAGGAEKAINAGVPHSFTGLNEDSTFGVIQVPLTEDFFGNELDGTPDIGAFDTGTAGTPVTGGGNELKASLYEVRNTTELHVPFTGNNPLRVEDLAAGLTVSDGASVKVYDNGTEVTDGNIAAGMTVKIVAGDGTENSTVYTIVQKNQYAHKADFVGGQQGNVWFHQVRKDGDLVDLTSFAGGNTGWWTGIGWACAEYNGAADDDAVDKRCDGGGFVFRAPVTGTVRISFPEKLKFRYGNRAYDNSFDTYVAVYVNGEPVEGKRVQIPKPATASSQVEEVEIEPFELTVARGDTIEFMAENTGTLTATHEPNSADVLFDVAVEYQDKAATAVPEDTKAPTAPGNPWVMNVTETSAVVSWNASTDNRGVTGYKVRVGSGDAETVTERTKLLTGLTAGTDYTVTVTAVDAAGNESKPASVTFRTASATVEDKEPPAAPTGGSMVSSTQKTAVIRWTASSSTDVVGYEVTVEGQTVTVRNATQATITGLTAGKEYTASIVAFDAAGNRSPALICKFSTAAPDETPPTAPSGVEAQNITRNSALIDWNAATDNVGVTGYVVKLGEAGEEIDVGARRSHAFTGLTVYTGYTVYVLAYDEAGNRSPWASVEFTTAKSNECELVSSLFELRGGTLLVPNAEPVTVAEFKAGLEVSEAAELKVCSSEGTEVTEGNIAAGMTVQVVAQDGTVNPISYTIARKNTYNSYADWVDQQQGNVWFYQYQGDDAFVDFSGWDSTWSCWSAGDYRSVERNQACGALEGVSGSGFTFRAPVSGTVMVSLNYDSGSDSGTNAVRRRQANAGNTISHYLRIYLNGVELSEKAIELPNSTEPVTVEPMKLDLKRGDKLSFMARNEGDKSNKSGNNGIFFTPSVSYLNGDGELIPERVIVKKDGEEIGSEPVKLYTNKDHDSHSVTLTAETVPADAASSVLNWSLPSNASGMIKIVRNEDGSSVALTATEDELNVGAVDVEVACADYPETKATFTVHVIRQLENNITISGTPKFGETLTADLNQLSMSDAGKEGLSFQWKRDGEDIDGATGQTYTLTADDIGTQITVEATADPATFYEGTRTAAAGAAVAKAEQPAQPSGLTPTACTTAENNDGSITGLDGEKLYEYRLGEDGEWTAVEAGKTEITGLVPGSYQVRFAETGTHLAGSNAATVTVESSGITAHQIKAVVTPAEGGVLTLSANSAVQGEEITLTVNPHAGYQLKEGSLSAVYTDENGEKQALEITEGKFTMPNAEVTVSAAFEKIMVHITHDLTNISCSLAEHDHEVEYGEALTIKLTAAEGYTMPSSVTVTTAAGEAFTGYRYHRAAEKPDEASIEFETGVITQDLVITGAGVAKTFTVNYSLTNGLSAPEAEASRTVAYHAAYTGRLTAAEGYLLPDEIVVTMGGTLAGTADFTYDKATGEIRIPDGKIEGNLIITAAGVKDGVEIISVTGVSLPGQAKMNVGSTRVLTYTITPENATNKEVVWTSSDADVISIEEKTGLMRAHTRGTVTITVTTLDGRYQAACSVSAVDGGTADLSALSEAYMAAKDVTNDNYTDESWNTFAQARDAVKAILDADGAGYSAEQIAAAAQALTDAKSGLTKDSGSGSYVPSTPSTTTKVEKNPDGSTTTTVTNKKTGTVTETTEKPDGSKETVETKKDGTVTETKADPQGGTVKKVTDPEKNVEIKVTDASGEVLAQVSLPGEVPAPETRFDDVPEDHWADEAIHQLVGLELINGVGGNRYDLNASMKRGDLALTLSRLSEAGTDYKLEFTDVPSGKYYASGIAWAAKTGVVTGYSADLFKPEGTITRDELAVMLYRYAKLLKLDTSAAGNELDTFTDGTRTPDWALEGMSWCVKNGILRGKGNDTLDPRSNVTRAEVAVMLQRFITLIK